MTLGCGSWGGNVTSDNISPIHLMDIKRVAFETRAVPSKRPARSTNAQPASVRMNAPAPPPQSPPAPSAQGARISREEVASIVDRFLAGRGAGSTPAPLHTEMHASASPPPVESVNEINANWIDTKSSAAPHAEAAPTARDDNGNARQQQSQQQAMQTATPKQGATGNGGQASTNGRKPVDFVSEDDVRRAVLKGEKIYVNAKTIITPSAHDIGDAAEVFAKI
jgi:hypothetical protein